MFLMILMQLWSMFMFETSFVKKKKKPIYDVLYRSKHVFGIGDLDCRVKKKQWTSGQITKNPSDLLERELWMLLMKLGKYPECYQSKQ